MPWSKRSNKKTKESDDSFAPLQKKWGGADAIEIIDVNEVIVPDEMPEPDPDLVGDIAESIRIIGLIHPIPVRSHPTALGRKTETILVTGRARLAAYKLLGRTYIPCAVFPDDDVADRFIRLSENLFRQSATALREAEDIAEFVRHIEALKLSLSGQNVQKRGRPRGAVSRAAEQLPIEAKTAEARQKKIERAIKIDQIIPEIKEEIRKRHLDDNQSAVLAIAEKPSILEQRKAVQRLGRDRPTRKTALEARMAETMTSDEQERYKIILAAWGVSAELKSAWRGATKEQRERFINEVLRGPHYDAEGAITLVKNAFAARKQILVQDLHRLGARYGFTKKVIREIVKHLKITKKRLSRDRNEPWYYINTDKNWKDQVPAISNREFEDLSPPKPKPKKERPISDKDDDDDDDKSRRNALDEDEEFDRELDELFPDWVYQRTELGTNAGNSSSAYRAALATVLTASIVASSPNCPISP